MIDDPRLQDGMDKHWDPQAVAEVIKEYLTSKQGELEITFIVTFDKQGVSGHPNHIAVHKGVAVAFEEAKFPFDVLCLVTVNTIRKYLGYADIYNIGSEHMHYVLLHPVTSLKAMAIHHSQFVWYRKLFTIFSSYAYCNSFDLYS